MGFLLVSGCLAKAEKIVNVSGPASPLGQMKPPDGGEADGGQSLPVDQLLPGEGGATLKHGVASCKPWIRTKTPRLLDRISLWMLRKRVLGESDVHCGFSEKR